MIQSKKVLIASDVLFSFIDRVSAKHEQAAAYFRYFSQEEYQVYLDITSILTVYNTIHDDISTSLAKDFMRTIGLTDINIIFPDESDLKGAIKVLANTQASDLTLQKALISVLADKRKIGQICTFEYLHPLFGISLFYLPI
jgi:predicted nucleic acid-binding protein